MIIYKSIGALLVCLILGFILGRFTASKPSEIITKTETVDSSHQIAKVTTQADTKKDSNKEKIEFIEHKTYSNKGKLKSETAQKIMYIDRSKNDVSIQKLAVQSVQDTKTIVTETKTIYQKNWLVGLSIPFSSVRNYSHFDLVDVRALLAYRVIGNFYVTASTNYKLQYSEVGVLYGF